MPKPEIVFFGSGPVAAKSLELLLSDFSVVAVVTKPKPLHHRGSFPVLDVTEKHRLPTHTVSNKQELSDLIATKPFQSEVALLIDFGIIVGQDVIDYFPKGIINSHFSLLPEWRGADPITFAILSGQAKTGVSLMLLVEAMDEGPIIACGVEELDGTETTPRLTERLISLSDALLKKEVPRYLAGDTTGVDQAEMANLIPDYPRTPTYSRKLTKADGKIDILKSAAEIEREIRAFIEWPKSYTALAGQEVIITKAHVADQPGEKALALKTSKSYLVIDLLKPVGKAEMTASAFLAGYGKRLGLQ